MEALNKAYAGKGISFYWVLSREPHPGFYGFTQTDSLEMRKEYVRLADAELQLELPWIIDDMENTMQQTYGRMPNSEFIVAPDGELLYSKDWADPDTLKEWLEDKFGPSGISDDEWAELSARDQTAMTIGNNDEVPMSEVPYLRLNSLDAKRMDDDGDLPFVFEAGTLPPKITEDGQSRLYMTIKPVEGKGISFDKTQEIVVDFANVKGVSFIKDQLKSGKRRSREEGDLDVYPHTLGVLWNLEGGAAQMEFKATVTANIIIGEGEAKQVTAKYLVSGYIPEPAVITDEVPAAKVPKGDEVGQLEIQAADGDDIPMDVEAKVDKNNRKIYLYLKVSKATGHKWNNLSAPPKVKIKPISGVVLEKNELIAAKHPGEGDTNDRILAVTYAVQAGTIEFVFDITPEAWICNDDLGWCRIFSKTYRITGKL